jgi:hypothetical protein
VWLPKFCAEELLPLAPGMLTSWWKSRNPELSAPLQRLRKGKSRVTQ